MTLGQRLVLREIFSFFQSSWIISKLFLLWNTCISTYWESWLGTRHMVCGQGEAVFGPMQHKSVSSHSGSVTDRARPRLAPDSTIVKVTVTLNFRHERSLVSHQLSRPLIGSKMLFCMSRVSSLSSSVFEISILDSADRIYIHIRKFYIAMLYSVHFTLINSRSVCPRH